VDHGIAALRHLAHDPQPAIRPATPSHGTITLGRWLTPPIADLFIFRSLKEEWLSIASAYGLRMRPPRAALDRVHDPVNVNNGGLQVKTVRPSARARIAAVGIATSGAMLLAGCGASNETAPAASTGGSTAAAVSGTISGAGASTQQAATQAWVAGFQGTSPDATINYDPSGSGAGRTQFEAGGVDWAGSDAYITGDEIKKAQTTCGGDYVEVPDYISPIAVVFNLPGVTSLQLTPSLIAKIFSKSITKWNDPAIAAVNAGVTLPDLAISPVNRSDKSGTTQNFTDYLSQAAPADWTNKASDTWPLQGGEAAQGTSGVIGAVKAGSGTIGYADESQAGGLGKAKIQVGTSYVDPTADGAAKLAESATRVTDGGQYSYAFKLARTTTDPSTYPITLVSYFITCAKNKDAAKAALLKSYLNYVISSDGQAAAAKAAGSAPISDGLRSMITPAVNAIS
jgi:phosphate transport system substrate-binding protein